MKAFLVCDLYIPGEGNEQPNQLSCLASYNGLFLYPAARTNLNKQAQRRTLEDVKYVVCLGMHGKSNESELTDHGQ